jgi:hypothetical protein
VTTTLRAGFQTERSENAMPSPLRGEPFDRLRATSNVEWGGHAVAEGEGVPGEGVRGAAAFRSPSSGALRHLLPTGEKATLQCLNLFAALLLLTIAPAFAGGDRNDRGDRNNRDGPPPLTFISEYPEHPVDIILARPTASSVTVSVLSYSDAECYVAYGLQPDALSSRTEKKSLKKGVPAEFVLADLKADTQYHYQLRSTTGDAPLGGTGVGTFHTQRPAGSTFVFTVQADSHLDSNTSPELYARTLKNALADKPDFHIDLGDTFMIEKQKDDFHAASKQYLSQRYHLGLLCHSAPLFLTLGNHEGEGGWLNTGTGESNMAVWSNMMRKKYFPNPVPDSFYTGNATKDPKAGLLENYYAWQWGEALFVVLDPFWPTAQKARRNDPGTGCWNWTLGAEQYRWLTKTLSESKARYKFIFIHHLVGGLDRNCRGGSEAATLYEWGGKNEDGSDGFKAQRPGWEMPIHALLVRNHVNIVFHGHDHFYAKQDLDGIVYQMAPQPGHFSPREKNKLEEYGYKTGTLLPSAGHVRVTVSPAKTTVEYVRAYLPKDETEQRKNGQIEHAYTLSIP